MNQQVLDNIKELYKQDNIPEIISRTVFLMKTALELGYNVGECYTRTHDYGIKPNEMGISLAIVLKQIDSSKLSQKDLLIKTKILKEYQEAISTWEKGLENY